MIFLNKEARLVNVLPGITRKTLAESQSMMLCEFKFEAQVQIPVHSHPNDQVGYLVEGHVEMIIEGKKYELNPGDSYCAPSNVPHGAYTLEPSVIIDTFSPPREDYR